MKKTSKILLALLCIFTSFSSKSAIGMEIDENPVLQAVINGENKVEISKTIELSAKDSFVGDELPKTQYEWDFGDETKAEGRDIAHTYEKPGIYNITLKIKKGTESETIEKEIFVYNKQILIITDSNNLKEKIKFIEEYAKNENVYVNLVESFNSATDFISQEILFKKLNQENEKIEASKDIMIWTSENAGINALNRYLQLNDKQKEIFSEKNIILVGDINSMDKQRLSGYFKTITPQNMIITKESVIYPLTEYSSDLKQELIKKGIEFYEINEDTGNVKIWNIMSYTINKLISKGIHESTIMLLLLFPLIITILIFLKQIVGINLPNILFPSLITLTFLVIGFYTGIFIVSVSAFTVFIVKKILKNTSLLYATKTGIILITLSFQMLFLLILNNFLELFNNEFLSIAIIPTMFLMTITEQTIKSEISFKKMIKTITNLLIICSTIYFILGGPISIFTHIIQFTNLKEFTLIHTEIIPILIVFNYLIGKWTGLRLLERIRFRNLLKNLD